MDANTRNVLKNEVYKYVEKTIDEDKILLAEYGENTYNKIGKERANLRLYSSLITNPELKANIISLIVDYAFKYREVYYKDNLEENLSNALFMRNIKSFLHPQQIISLAHLFNKQLETQKTKGQTR